METKSVTKLYEQLAQKIGRTEAESLTQFIDVKIKDELGNKIEILATKQDLFALKEEMHALRLSTKDEIHLLRNEMNENALSIKKWVLGIFITLVIMILGLYAGNFLKH